MKKFLLPLLLLGAGIVGQAQEDYPEALWAGRMTGVAGGDVLQNMIVDTEGDLVALSYIASTATVTSMEWMGAAVPGVTFSDVYAGNSNNKNAVITKHNPETGEILWTAYSTGADWGTGQGAVRQTADGGFVFASKLRLEDGAAADSQPLFVGADGTQTELTAAQWTYNDSRIYNVGMVKLSPSGVVEWVKVLQVNPLVADDNTPEEEWVFASDGVVLADVAVNGQGEILLGGRVATAIELDSSNELVATANQGWNGDSQTTVGNLFVARFAADGAYEAVFFLDNDDAVSKAVSLDYKDGKLLLCATVTGTEDDQAYNFGSIADQITVSTLPTLVVAAMDPHYLMPSWVKALPSVGYNGSQVYQNGRANLIGDDAYAALQWQGAIDLGDGETLSVTEAKREGLIICLDGETGSLKGAATSRETFGEAGAIIGYHNVMQSPVSEDSVYVCGSWLAANKGLMLRSYTKGDLQTNGLTTYTLTSAGMNATGYAVENDGVVYSYFRPNKEALVMGSDEIVEFATNGYTIVMAAHRFAPATVDEDPSVWNGVVPEADADYAFSGGEGSEFAPYMIATPADLAQLAANVNSGITYADMYFVQTTDIALNSETTTHEWAVIGTSNASSFQGTYDGQGHAISRMRCTVRQNYSGLFGFTKGATLMNISVEDAYADFQLDNLCVFGAIAGDAMGTVIINCSSTGDLAMNLAVTNKSGYLGGIVGMGAANSGIGNNIVNCYSYANLLYTADDECIPLMQYVAGISAQVNGNIQNCFYGGHIEFEIETGAKYFASAIAANLNGAPEYTHNYYALAEGSSNGIYGINTADDEGAIDASNLTVADLVAELNQGANSLAGNGYQGKVKNWVEAGNQVAFGEVISESGITNAVAPATELDPNAPRYNVMGQRVSTSYRGIVIQNGKKFYVK